VLILTAEDLSDSRPKIELWRTRQPGAESA